MKNLNQVSSLMKDGAINDYVPLPGNNNNKTEIDTAPEENHTITVIGPEIQTILKFSFFEANIKEVLPMKDVDLIEIYNLIRSKGFKSATEKLRLIKDKEKQSVFKKENFQHVTFSGIFSYRSQQNLEIYSGLMVLDLDDLQNPTAAKDQLMEDEYFQTQLLFLSPRGHGLKWVVYIGSESHSHLIYFNGISNYLKNRYGFNVDPSGKDICRTCFLPHDPDVYINPNINNMKNKKEFVPSDWVSSDNLSPSKDAMTFVEDYDKTLSKVEDIITQIEAKRIDITSVYDDWVDICFAFVHEFNEYGREYFRRVSKFNVTYTDKDCDDQFKYCLNSEGKGITIATFFYLAKRAGIEATKKTSPTLPTFPKSLFPQLPQILNDVIEAGQSAEEKDILLLGSLTALSACFPKFYGIYKGKRVHTNLFMFIIGPASSGKGILIWCRELVGSIHKTLRKESEELKHEYNIKLKRANSQKESELEKPDRPPEKMLFIPANNSATGMFQLLSENNGNGLIFETEGDTLSATFGTDYGNYSDGFRKAFQNEPISFFRRGKNEYVDIPTNSLAALLSGTPKQVSNLIKSVENGLFSRFMFYSININPEWKDVFSCPIENGLDDYFDHLSLKVFRLYELFNRNSNICFCFSPDQQKQFTDFFSSENSLYFRLYGCDFLPTNRRLGLICFRISMILSALRFIDKSSLPDKIVCEDDDFHSSLEIIKILWKHSSQVFDQLTKQKKGPIKVDKKQKLFDSLPNEFNRVTYLQIADSLNICDKTAQRHIDELIKEEKLFRLRHNCYSKIGNEEVEEVEDL